MGELALADIERCFGGAIPAVVATRRPVVAERHLHLAGPPGRCDRVALSNQFMSKTSRNLAVNPRASLLLIDPVARDEFRLSLVFERTERRGPVSIACAPTSMRSRCWRTCGTCTGFAPPTSSGSSRSSRTPPTRRGPCRAISRSGVARRPSSAAWAELARRTRAGDLDTLVGTALEGLDRLLGYRHTLLLLLDEEGTGLSTIGSRGFDTQGVGAGGAARTGMIGSAAERSEPLPRRWPAPDEEVRRTIRLSYEQNRASVPAARFRSPRSTACRAGSWSRRWRAVS